MSRRYARREEVDEVRRLFGQGLNNCQVSRITGIPLSTIWAWRRRPATWPRERWSNGERIGAACPRCDGRDLHEHSYAYLLGLYLGDGSLARSRRVHRLEVTLDRRYPRIVQECAHAIEAVRGAGCHAGIRERPGCLMVSACWKHWQCVFPQHGPGPKHTRPIRLERWQERIVADHPQRLLRGLIHSDGYRGANVVKGKPYMRYQFTNTSADIRRIFCDTLDVVGIRWRQMNWNTISVARRADVEALDRFIGPKR